MCMQDFKRCPVESASPVRESSPRVQSASPVRESSPQNTLGLLGMHVCMYVCMYVCSLTHRIILLIL